MTQGSKASNGMLKMKSRLLLFGVLEHTSSLRIVIVTYVSVAVPISESTISIVVTSTPINFDVILSLIHI